MTPLFEFLNELGEEILGTRWLPLRRHVEAWLKANPERAAWLDYRLRQYWRRDP